MPNCLCPIARSVPSTVRGLQRKASYGTVIPRPARTIAARAVGDQDVDISLSTSYSVAETSVWLTGILMIALPELVIEPLVPPGAPPGALASGCAALRVAASFAPLLATSMSCLGKADVEGNLLQSTTYRKLNTACLATSVFALVMTTVAYFEGDNMNHGLLLITVSTMMGPILWATVRGCRGQGLQTMSALADSIVEDTKELKQSLSTLEPENANRFYQVETALAVLVGSCLLLLPAVIVEAPEPNFTAETLMRRIAGVEALCMLGGINALLLDATTKFPVSKRGGPLVPVDCRSLNGSAALTTTLVVLALTSLSMVDAKIHIGQALAVQIALLPSLFYAGQGFDSDYKARNDD